MKTLEGVVDDCLPRGLARWVAEETVSKPELVVISGPRSATASAILTEYYARISLSRKLVAGRY